MSGISRSVYIKRLRLILIIWVAAVINEGFTQPPNGIATNGPSNRTDISIISNAVTARKATATTKNSDDTASTRQEIGDKLRMVARNDADENERRNDDPYDDIVQEFLSKVAEYDAHKENCTPGVTFHLGDGVIAQYGLKRYRSQAMLAVNRANFMTRLWKYASLIEERRRRNNSIDLTKQKSHPDVSNNNETIQEAWESDAGGGGSVKDMLSSEYFLYSQVRSMVESDEHVFAAGNCYDQLEYKNYTLFCAYAFRTSADSPEVMVKDLSVEYKYLGDDFEFFSLPRRNAERKLASRYRETEGEF